MLEVLVIEQNNFWMEKVSTLGLDCGFHVVLVRVVDGNYIPTICFSGWVITCAQ